MLRSPTGDRLAGAVVRREPRGQLVEELELVGEFRVDRRGRVRRRRPGRRCCAARSRRAARRWHAGNRCARTRRGSRRWERRLGEDRDAVIALHSVHVDVLVAERGERLAGEELIRGLGLLEARTSGRASVKRRHTLSAREPHRIDVPGDEAQRHRVNDPINPRAGRVATIDHGDICGLQSRASARRSSLASSPGLVRCPSPKWGAALSARRPHDWVKTVPAGRCPAETIKRK